MSNIYIIKQDELQLYFEKIKLNIGKKGEILIRYAESSKFVKMKCFNTH